MRTKKTTLDEDEKCSSKKGMSMSELNEFGINHARYLEQGDRIAVEWADGTANILSPGDPRYPAEWVEVQKEKFRGDASSLIWCSSTGPEFYKLTLSHNLEDAKRIWEQRLKTRK